MATSVYIIGTGANTIYLNNSTGSPVQNGDPGSATTTSIMLADKQADLWTIQTAHMRDIVADDIWVARSYEPVTETIRVVITAGYAVASAALTNLTRLLGAAALAVPAALVVQPHGATAAQVAQILGGWVQPVGVVTSTIGAGVDHMFVDITILRSPFWYGTTTSSVIGSQSLTNNNTISMSVPTSDLTSDGDPLNITWTRPASTPDPVVMYMASIKAKITTTGGSVPYSHSATAFLPFALPADLANNYSAFRRLRIRPIVQLSTMTAPEKTRVQVGITASGGPEGTRGPITLMGTNTVGQIVDGGMFDPDWLRAPNASGSSVPITVNVYTASTDGTVVSGTITAVHLLVYYDFCALNVPQHATTATQHYELNSITPYAVGPTSPVVAWLPMTPRHIVATNTTNVAVAPGVIRGTPPRYFLGAALWAAWYGTNRAWTAADTTTISAVGAQVFLSYRT